MKRKLLIALAVFLVFSFGFIVGQPQTVKLLPNGIEITTTELKYLQNDLIDENGEGVEKWVLTGLAKKISKCRGRFKNEWYPKLEADPTVTTIPADEEAFVTLVTSRPDYKNRKQREAEAIR